MERIQALQNEIEDLRKTLNAKEIELHALKKAWNTSAGVPLDQYYKPPESYELPVNNSKLPRWAIERYCRQMLVPEIGAEGQKKLCKAKVLIIGAGGLGYPAGSYLAGAGIGEIGIVDYDTVDVSNLHRQLWHSEQEQGINKVDSAADFLRRINSNIKITTYHTQITSENALDLVSKYNVVLDCSDNVPTRYLINDACIFVGVPLISGSALKMEGQLTIYGYKAAKNPLAKECTYEGPCYRCLFPSPPPAQAVGSCSSSGVLGPVTGVIGSLQALEAVKLLVGQSASNLLVGRMLLFDGGDCVFRVVKLRNKNPDCETCSEEPTITELLDYESFCNMKAKEGDPELKILPPENRIGATELSKVLLQESEDKRHLLVDVRNEVEFNMCCIDNSINFPIDLLRRPNELERLKNNLKDFEKVTFICRRGNDSQIVAQKILDEISEWKDKINDLIGGLHAWSKYVDNEFPLY